MIERERDCGTKERERKLSERREAERKMRKKGEEHLLASAILCI